MDRVLAWLGRLGLEEYCEAFERNHIDLALLHKLTDRDLRQLGVASLGHRKKLLLEIDKLGREGWESCATSEVQFVDPINTGSKAQRRQLTVLFCDVVDSTKLAIALDPENLQQVMREYHACCTRQIERYGGRVAQYLGDGVMAYFGWPVAHEDDAERAVRAALEILPTIEQMDRPRIQVRIGIATGPVVVGGLHWDPARSDDLAVGDTPNLASRLQSLADPGQIVISTSTHRLIGRRFELTDLGEHPLKGFDYPVHAWRVECLSALDGRFEAKADHLTPLFGRAGEMALVRERWAQAKIGEGQVVVITGDAGIGKSRLIQALRDHVSGQDHVVLRYQCSPYHTQSAFFPIIEQLKRAAGLSPADSAAEQLSKLEALLGMAGVGNEQNVPLIAALLSIPTGDRYPPLAFVPQKQKEETILALCDQLSGLSGTAPVLFVIEDVHWVDPSTLEALDAAVQLVSTHAVLMVLTCRPEFGSRWTEHDHVTSLTLNRLDRQQTRAMIDSILGDKILPEATMAKLLLKADGVPLFVEELTKSVVEQRDEPNRQATGTAQTTITVPESLKDSLMARLDRLTPVRKVAQIAACIGREFRTDVLSLACGLDQPSLDLALAQLVKAKIIFGHQKPSGNSYSFKHVLLQDAAHESMLIAERNRVHARIAEVLVTHFPDTVASEPEVVAHHFTVAGNARLAIPHWYAAGLSALRRVALQEAIAHLSKGLAQLAELPASAERDALELDLRATLGLTWMVLRGWAAPEVAQHLEPAWELSRSLDRDHHTLGILWGLWIYQLCTGKVRTSLEWADVLLQQAERTGRDDLYLAGHWAKTAAHFWLGEFELAIAHGDAILSRYELERDRGVADLTNWDPKTVALVYKGMAEWMLGRPERGRQLAEQAVEHARLRGHLVDIGFSLFHAAFIYGFRRQAERFGAWQDELERSASEQGLLFYQYAAAPVNRAWWLAVSGRYSEAYAKFPDAIQQWSSLGLLIGLPMYKSLAAECALLCGEVAVAQRLIDECAEQMSRVGWEERAFEAEVLRIQGRILLETGDTAQAETALRAAVEAAQKQTCRSLELRAIVGLARVLATQRRSGEVVSLLGSTYSAFTEGLDTPDLQEAKRALDELAP